MYLSFYLHFISIFTISGLFVPQSDALSRPCLPHHFIVHHHPLSWPVVLSCHLCFFRLLLCDYFSVVPLCGSSLPSSAAEGPFSLASRESFRTPLFHSWHVAAAPSAAIL
ncbi:hypothetical protein V8C26DRAFT_388020 [Trichoderma gracile]